MTNKARSITSKSKTLWIAPYLVFEGPSGVALEVALQQIYSSEWDLEKSAKITHGLQERFKSIIFIKSGNGFFVNSKLSVTATTNVRHNDIRFAVTSSPNTEGTRPNVPEVAWTNIYPMLQLSDSQTLPLDRISFMGGGGSETRTYRGHFEFLGDQININVKLALSGGGHKSSKREWKPPYVIEISTPMGGQPPKPSRRQDQQ